MAARPAHSAPAPAAPRVDAQAFGDSMLPALSANKKDCARLLARENCTLGDVVDIIMADPGLTIAVLQAVNRKRGANRVRIASVESAANLLGQTRLQKCVAEVPELEALCLANNLPMTLALWERQRHAAAQAAHWAQLREDKSPSECRIAALCAGLPELMVCVYQPDAYRCVLARQDTLGSQGASAALGTDFAALGRMLVQQWCLPELLDDVFHSERHEFYRPLGVVLASELARVVDAGWYTPRAVVCLEVIADYLGWPYDRCVEMVHQVAVRSARSGAFPGAVAAAARMLQLPGEVTITGVEAERSPPPGRTEADDHQARLQGILLQCKQQLRGADLRGVLSLTMQMLHKRLKFSRCAFFVLDRNHQTMQARLALGEGVAALRQLQLEVGTSRVLQTLLKKPQSLLVNDQNARRYTPHLPAAFNEASADAFACMSLFAGERPIGVVYVDRRSADEFGADHYACFKTLCGLANQSLRAAVAKAKTAAKPIPRVA